MISAQSVPFEKMKTRFQTFKDKIKSVKKERKPLSEKMLESERNGNSHKEWEES